MDLCLSRACLGDNAADALALVRDAVARWAETSTNRPRVHLTLYAMRRQPGTRQQARSNAAMPTWPSTAPGRSEQREGVHLENIGEPLNHRQRCAALGAKQGPDVRPGDPGNVSDVAQGDLALQSYLAHAAGKDRLQSLRPRGSFHARSIGCPPLAAVLHTE